MFMNLATDAVAMSRRRHYVLALLALVLGVTGCLDTAPRREVRDQLEDATLNRQQLRMQMLDLMRRSTEQVERTADEITRRSGDREVRRLALLWKTNAAALCQLAVSHDDPFLSMLDLWSFLVQMRQYFDNGAGKSTFGEHQALALEACLALEEEARGIAMRLTPEQAETLNNLVYGWTVKHLLPDLSFTRWDQDASLISYARARSGDVLSSVAVMEDRIDLLVETLPHYVRILPKQLRWNGELLLDDALGEEIETVMREVGVLSGNLDRIGTLVESVPDLIEEQRAATLAEVVEVVERERTGLIEVVDQQRLATVDTLREELDRTIAALREERGLALADVERQRQETLEVVRGERALVLDNVQTQRIESIEEVERIVEEAIADIQPEARDAIDYFFERATPLVGALIGGMLVGGLFLAVLWTRRRRAA